MHGPWGSTSSRFQSPNPWMAIEIQKISRTSSSMLSNTSKLLGRPQKKQKWPLANIHLIDNAKLWWKSKVNDAHNGLGTINTWDNLKKELRAQLFLENVEYIPRRKLRELRHTGTIQDYMKQFSPVMLDICDMSDKYKVFIFVEGLKQSARTN